MHQKTNDYYLGLLYCVCNDIENAYFYLNRATKRGNEIAKQTLEELKEKNLLPHMKERKNGFRFQNTSSS